MIFAGSSTNPTENSKNLRDQNPSAACGTLAIVIVNWNSGQYLRRCLESLEVCEGLTRIGRVVVVDNNSHDNSCLNLPMLSVPFRLIQNQANLGFAAACNQGAAICETTYLLFLNPDTVLHANSLQVPLEYLDNPQHSDLGICGIQLTDEAGRVSRTCSRLPTCTSLFAMATRLHSLLPRLFLPHFMKEWDHLTTREVEQVIGAFFVVRRDLFEKLHGFDEQFFVYFEEVDFCQRARILGSRTMFLADAQAEHVGGGCSQQIRGRSLFYSLRSRVLYAQKHFNRIQSMLVGFSTFVLEPVIRIATMLVSFKLKNIGPLSYGFSLLWWNRWIAGGITSTTNPSSKAISTLPPENRNAA